MGPPNGPDAPSLLEDYIVWSNRMTRMSLHRTTDVRGEEQARLTITDPRLRYGIPEAER